MKILMVDDSSVMRQMTKILLGDICTEFFECQDGVEALAAYENYQPDWVLMDWEMTVVDGLTATREILGHYPEAQIVMFTQHDDADLKEAAREAGALDFIRKDDLIDLRRIMTSGH